VDKLQFARSLLSGPGLVAGAASFAAGAAKREQTAGAPNSLKILHVLRAPLGGLFRHVLDVARGQAARGHRVGLIVDSSTGGARAEAVLAELSPRLALGIGRVAMQRELSTGDMPALRHVSRRIAALAPDVVHGHGAKGAAFARLASCALTSIRVYTPHGGSLVYSPGTINGGFYRSLEWLLNWRTDLFLFESSYIADMFRRKIGRPRAMVRVVRNGVSNDEFEPVNTLADATDIVCVGELRAVKAIDVLIDALAALRQSGRLVSATIAGEGPDDAALRAQVSRLGLSDQVRFVGFRPAREAFAMGRILVIPSRAESLPYIVLEAAAAGMPIISTSVGGIPEIFGPLSNHLIACDNLNALIGAIGAALDDPGTTRRIAQEVQTRVRAEFSLSAMVDGGLAAYRDALAVRKLAQFA
jgi:glycosyltransferase involved in cell wall biosynthesis